MDLVQMQDALFETTLHSSTYKDEEFEFLQNPRMIKWARKDLRKAAETAAKANQAIAKLAKKEACKPAAAPAKIGARAAVMNKFKKAMKKQRAAMKKTEKKAAKAAKKAKKKAAKALKKAKKTEDKKIKKAKKKAK